MTFYFAYGSNMSTRRLNRRVSSAVVVDTATLAGHRLTFRKKSRDGSGKCDIPRSESDVVYGVLFRIDPTDIAKLDAVEGNGHGYQREMVLVSPTMGDPVEAFTYVATDIDESLVPYSWYKTHVLIGAREARLPAPYIARIEEVPEQADPNKEQVRDELQIYDGDR